MQTKSLAEQQLCLTGQANRLIECGDGRTEVAPWRAESRRTSVQRLTLALRALIVHLRGKVRFTPYTPS